jgi:hypothetical protein
MSQVEIFWDVTACSFALKMDAAWASETSVSYHDTKRYHKPDNLHLKYKR